MLSVTVFYIFMNNIERLRPEGNSHHESAEHDKVLEGMFAEVEGEIVKILSADEDEKMATIQYGKDGDTDGISFEKLRTLKTSERVVAEWESVNKRDASEDRLAA